MRILILTMCLFCNISLALGQENVVSSDSSGVTQERLVQERTDKTIEIMREVNKAVLLFRTEKGVYPTDSQGFKVLVPYLKDTSLLKDAWGNDLVYTFQPQSWSGAPYAIYSFGADGVRGGKGLDIVLEGKHEKGFERKPEKAVEGSLSERIKRLSIAYWKMDDCVLDVKRIESRLVDSSSNKYNGILYGTDTVSGISSLDTSKRALYFDGVNDFASIPPQLSPEVTSEGKPVPFGGSYPMSEYLVGRDNLTVSAWIYPIDKDNPSGGAIYFDRGRGNGNVAISMAVRSGKFVLSGWSPGVKTYELYVPVPHNNYWYLMTATFDADEVKLYINGELGGTTSLSGVYLVQGGEGICLGRSLFPNKEEFFNGAIEEIFVSRITLTSSEAKQLYEDTLTTANGGSLKGSSEEYVQIKSTITMLGILEIGMWKYWADTGAYLDNDYGLSSLIRVPKSLPPHRAKKYVPGTYFTPKVLPKDSWEQDYGYIYTSEGPMIYSSGPDRRKWTSDDLCHRDYLHVSKFR